MLVSWSFIALLPLIVICQTPLQIELYYESLCPGCHDFITGSLSEALKVPDLDTLVNITLIPYGNANEKQTSSGWTFTCQHGRDECYGNLIETCALNLLPKRIAILFISCLESGSDKKSFDVAGQDCSKELELDWFIIKGCTTSAQGNGWQHEMAVKTDMLNPVHQYVPWIVVNGIHDFRAEQQIQDDLLKYACKHSKVLIPDCTPFLRIDNEPVFHSRKCYKEEIIAF